MVKSPATAATMAYPTEEEKRSHRHITDIINDDGNVDDDDDDDVVRGNGNREARSNRDLESRRACGFKNDKDNFVFCPSDRNNESKSKNDVNDTSYSDLTCSYLALVGEETDVRLPEPCHSQNPAYRQDEKENRRRPNERRRKQSQPRQIKWHWDGTPRNLIPALGLRFGQDLTNIEKPNKRQKIGGKTEIITRREQKSIRQRMFKCYLCQRYSPARGMSRRPYHTRVSLILHKLWRHKRQSCHINNYTSTVSLPSVSSITLKATFFTNPNFRYHR